MRLPKHIIVTRNGHYMLHFTSGDPKRLTLAQFIAEVRKDEWLPVYKEVA